MTPINYDYYNLAMNQKVFDKEKTINDIQQTTGEYLDNIIDHFVVKIGMPKYKKTVKLNFTADIDCLLQSERMKEKVLNLNTRGLYAYPNTIETGDYITYNDGHEIANYLVVSRVDRKPTHDYTLVQHCPYDCKILGSDGKTIYNYPIYQMLNKLKLGVSERSDTAITLNSTFQGYVKHDSISRRFIEDCSAGKRIPRILIDGIAYTITETFSGGMKGLILLGYEKDQVLPNIDNLELGIADYYNNILTPTPTPSEIIGDTEIYLGDTQEYSIDSTYPCTWNINDVGIDIISTNGNKCTLKCKSSTQYKGNTATLTCVTNGQTYTKQIKIIGF